MIKVTEMRIRTFCKFVEASELEPMVLRDAAVVVDATNYFYTSYKESGLPHAFGCEGDRYAAYLRQQLTMFQRANIKCYFLFKGGNAILDKKINRCKDHTVPVPTFMTDMVKEVLKEMGFDYVVCEYESKSEIIALAQQLDCPIISYDVEYCFSALRYIPRHELKFSEADNAIHCKYFHLEKFLRKHSLTNEKMAIFIALTDENIFPEGFFSNFFTHIKAPLGCYKRNLHLLYWLSKRDRKIILMEIYKFILGEVRTTFSEEQEKALKMIGQREGGLGAATALRREAAAVARRDPRWFAKGVAVGHIATNYINLYRSKHFFGYISEIPPPYENPTLFSLDIVKYAYDLLTNFENEGFILVHELHGMNVEREMVTVAETHSIRKPAYEADVCVFENGWDGLGELGLFEHFLSECLGGAAPARLERAPADARLLLTALQYFARKCPADTAAAAAAVLLSYVALSVVFPKADKNNLPKPPFAMKPILESSLDKEHVTEEDCNIAAAILAEYGTASFRDVEKVEWGVYHPLAQFQECLGQLRHLSALCGALLAPTALHRAYNGSLVYKLTRAARYAGDTTQFLDKLMGPAPTVYAFLNGLIDVHQEIA